VPENQNEEALSPARYDVLSAANSESTFSANAVFAQGQPGSDDSYFAWRRMSSSIFGMARSLAPFA